MSEVADFVDAELTAVNGLVVYFQSKRRFPSWTSPVRTRSPAPFIFNQLASFAPSPSGKSSRFGPLNGGYWRVLEGKRVDAFVFNGLNPLNASRGRWHSIETALRKRYT